MAGSRAYVSSAKCYEDRLWIGGDADPNAIAGFDGPFDDNATYWQTSDGTKNGDVLAIWKWEGDAAPPCWVGPLETDDDIEAVAATLTGTTLEISVTESGTALVDTVDLSSLLDDTDVSDVDVDLSFDAAGDLVVEVTVTEDGVDNVGSDSITLPSAPQMWDIP